MRDIHRSTTTWLARRTERGSAARPLHRSHRRRLTLEPLEDRALLSLTTWTVNSLGDTGTGSGTSGDLRYCITQADQTPGDNTINFSVTGPITLYSPLPDLSNTTGLMDIEGPGAANLTVARNSAAGTPDFGVFTVDSSVTASLNGLTISGGLTASGGAGIYNAGSLTVTSSAIDDNSAMVGGGIDNTGSLTVTNSAIDDNSATGSLSGGGGIYNAGSLTVTSSAIDDNSAYGYYEDTYGGGIYNSGTLTVTNSTIDNNSAYSYYSGGFGSGGGIYNAGTLTVANSTIDNNSANNYGNGSSYGGGIYNSGTLTVTNSTIDNNSAYSYGNGSSYGGGIYNTGTLNLDQCTLSGNVAFVYRPGFVSYGPGGDAFGGAVYTTGDLTLDDCTVSNNTAEGGPGYAAPGYEGATYTAGNASGGGVYVGLGTVHINGSSIEENSASGGNGEGGAPFEYPEFGGGGNAFGGGLMITNQAQAWISQTLIAANSALAGYGGSSPGGSYKGVTLALGSDGGSASGGGLYFDGASLSLTDSSIVQNQAIGGTGGNGVLEDSGSFTFTTPPPVPVIQFVGNGGSGSGGGLALDGGQSELVSDTVSGNSASGGPGGSGTYTYGVWYDYQLQGYITVPVFGSAGGRTGGGLSGTATLDNTIVALDTQGTGSGRPASDIAGSVSGAYNLIGIGGSGGLVNGMNGNQVGVADPGLDPRGLQNNGGPTQTIALVTGSPAIDAGNNALAVDPTTGQPLTTDQRGFPRIANGTVDIGAYEVQSYITAVAVGWGTQTAALQTAADGLRLLPAGRNTDLPWLGIDQVQITLTQPATLAAGDISVIGSSGTNYGPVTVTGSGTSYTITLAQPINAADRVTITIGNDLIAPFTRRLDVLPGDVNDDGVVNVQDLVAIRNQMLGLVGAVPTIFGDINGDGKVDINDYTAVRELIGTTLPSIT